MPYGNRDWNFSAPIDLSKTSVEGRKAVAAGPYNGKLVSVEPLKSKTNKPMVKLKINLHSSDDEGLQEALPENGAVIFDNLMLEGGDSGFRLKNICQVLGIEPPETQSLDDVNTFCEALQDASLPVMVGLRTYEGTDQNTVKYYGAEPPKDDMNGASKSKTKPGHGRKR